jgi:hypothetical protein
MGTVKGMSDSGRFLRVEFDENINGHGVYGKEGRCWTIPNEEDYVKLISASLSEKTQEKPMDRKFEKGDRVKCIKAYDGNTDMVGHFGTVLRVNAETLSVDFDESINGHEDYGAKRGCGWNFWATGSSTPGKYLEFADSDVSQPIAVGGDANLLLLL